ncbi:MAG: alpha/beta hydrolase [Bacteroidota bacterium]
MQFLRIFYFRPLISTCLCLVFFISSCSKKDNGIQDPFNPAAALQILNESYGTDPLQKADVYLPANRSAGTKTMILVHGGFWTSGDKTDMDTLLIPLRLADPNLAVVNMNYRLADGSGSNQHPAQMNDVKSLLDYIDANADKWHIGKDYALVGVSSGAHIALLYAYAFDPAKRVKVVASVLGPTNFADPLYSGSPIFQQLAVGLLGKTWLQDSALHKNVSPVFAINSNAPPTFMAYGGSDALVPVSNPDALKAKLISLNIPYQYFLYPPEGHDLTTPAIIDIISKMTIFFRTHL